MEILEFIIEQAYIMIPAFWVLGYIIKNTGWLKDKYVPAVLLLVSLGFTPLLLGGYAPENTAQAALVAGGAVFADQLYKQSLKKE